MSTEATTASPHSTLAPQRGPSNVPLRCGYQAVGKCGDGSWRVAICTPRGLHGARYCFWVDEIYRVTLRFEGGHAYEVDYEDFH